VVVGAGAERKVGPHGAAYRNQPDERQADTAAALETGDRALRDPRPVGELPLAQARLLPAVADARTEDLEAGLGRTPEVVGLLVLAFLECPPRLVALHLWPRT